MTDSHYTPRACLFCGGPLLRVRRHALARLVSLGTDICRSIARYAAAEEEVFAQYTRDRRRIYGRPARRFTSPFWDRRRLPSE